MPDTTKQPMDNTSQPSGRRGNLAVASVIALVLVALISAVLVHGHAQPKTSGQTSQTSPSVATTVKLVTCQGTTLGCNATPGLVGTVAPSTDQGITMQVTHAHLDATTTTMLVTVSSDTVTLGATSIDDGTVTDAQGQALPPSIISGGGHILSSHKVVIFYNLLPLSDTQLRQPQQFVFTAHHITTNEGKPLPGYNGAISGSWRSTFTVNPAPGSQYQIQAPSVTAQGVSFSVNSVEVAPASAQAGDVPSYGGVRVMLTATHVPANTLIDSFAGWYDSTAPRFGGCPSNGCPPRPAPTAATITLPGFVLGQDLNGISFVLAPTEQSTPGTVGTTQTVQIELLYSGSGTLSGADGTLTITNFHLFTSSTPTSADLKTTPTWQLPIPLHV